MSKRGVYHRAVARWGMEAQLRMLQEECAELIVAVNHHSRGRDSGLCSEMADVLIMIEQLRAADPAMNEMVGLLKTKKLKRLSERVNAV